jgi:V/A-type H+-transporting ATPase subunit A
MIKKPGRLCRVTGPTVQASGLEGVAMNEIALVGEARLLAEVVRIEGDVATLQVYEDTAGLRLGEPAERTGAPLSVELGPGLLGQVYDGVQRPLGGLAARDGDFLGRGATLPALDPARRWAFEAAVAPGQPLRGGERLGLARAPGQRDEIVLVPPATTGVVEEVLAGEFTVSEPVVRLAGGATVELSHRWPARRARPSRRRLPPDRPFLTGQRVLDCLFPVAAGGTAIVPGGFGTGKTVLEQTLARFAAADVVVFVGCGERGNEMAEVLDEFPRLTDPQSGGPLLSRTVLVVNTSNMPVAAREASIYTGVTIAEYFRDQSLQVALVVDSTSRWAEALREISSRLEELPGEEGYPTSLASRIAQFYERSGRVIPLSGAGEGGVTVIGAVSPPGGDFSEPVTQASLRASGVLWALSPDLAHRRHYPAVDPATSFSLDAARVDAWFRREVGGDWSALREEALKLLQRDRELQEVAQLVGLEALQDVERIALEAARLLREGFLRQSAHVATDAACPPAKTLAMLRLFLHFHRRAADAVARGVPARAILAGGATAGLLRLAATPAAEAAAEAERLRAEIDGALERARAE